jgi:transcriptional antiterminator RfaH
MPVLPLEPFVSPDDLFTDNGPPAIGEGCWYVLHTRPRAEKRLARELLAKDKSFFLPLHTRDWMHNGGKVRSYSPLFNGYVFLYGDEEARWTALKTNQVAQVIPVTDQRRLHNDLFQVHELMNSGQPLTPEERLEPGTPVEVTEGSLTGLRGTVIKHGKGLRLVIAVKMLNCGVSTEIESWKVRSLA